MENGAIVWENASAVPYKINIKLPYDSAIPLLGVSCAQKNRKQDLE